MQLHKLVHIKLGRFQDLDLADKDVLEGEDALGGLFDLLANHLWRKLAHKALDIHARDLSVHDLKHLLADRTDLGSLSVGGLADLVRPALCERNGEQADEVAVGGLDVDVRLDQRLPLADERAQLVGREIHAVEVEQGVLALDFVHAQLDFAEGLLLILAEISDGELDDTPADGISSIF